MSVVDLIAQTPIDRFQPCLDEVWVYSNTRYRTWKSSMLGAPIDTIEFVWRARLSDTLTCCVTIRQLDRKKVEVRVVCNERGRRQSEPVYEYRIVVPDAANSHFAPLARALIERTCRLVLPEQIPALIYVTRGA